MKLDKLSFIAGIVLVLAVLGCVGAVTIDDGGQFEWEISLDNATFFVLDRATGTVNEWNRDTQIARVFRFRSQ